MSSLTSGCLCWSELLLHTALKQGRFYGARRNRWQLFILHIIQHSPICSDPQVQRRDVGRSSETTPTVHITETDVGPCPKYIQFELGGGLVGKGSILLVRTSGLKWAESASAVITWSRSALWLEASSVNSDEWSFAFPIPQCCLPRLVGHLPKLELGRTAAGSDWNPEDTPQCGCVRFDLNCVII